MGRISQPNPQLAILHLLFIDVPYKIINKWEKWKHNMLWVRGGVRMVSSHIFAKKMMKKFSEIHPGKYKIRN